MSYIVRPANDSDLSFIFDELKKFSLFYDLKKYSLLGDDDEYTTQALKKLMQDHLFLVCCFDGQQIGFIVGLFGPHFFNPKLTFLAEQFWWVSEDHRRGIAGRLLLEAFLAEGKLKAQLVTFSLLPQSPVKPESLEKFGFKFKEHVLFLEN